MRAEVIKLWRAFSNSFVVVMRRELPTEEHKAAWCRFERLLSFRNNFTFLSKILYTVLWMSIGKANFQKSREYIALGKAHDEEFVAAAFDYLQYTMIAMTFFRVILMGLSYRFPAVCRIYVYYQIVYLSVEWCLPRDYGDMQTSVLYSENVLNFVLLYFDFWPSCLGFIFPCLVQAVMSHLHYDKEVDSFFVAELIFMLVWQFLNLLLCHYVITSVGLLYVTTETMNTSNEQLLNNLNEGVVINDSASGKLLFANKAATRLSELHGNQLRADLLGAADEGAIDAEQRK